MKKIAVEEHFITRESLEMIRNVMTGKYHDKKIVANEKFIDLEDPWDPQAKWALDKTGFMVNKLLDLGKGRVQDMNEAGIDVQVLSHVSPGIQVLNAVDGALMAKKCNDVLSDAIKKNPKRFAGLATIAPQDPRGAARELERAVTNLGFKGCVINSHTHGEYLDQKKFWIILEAAEGLDVPVYIHPRCPQADMIKPYLKYPMLATPMLGFSHEVSLHAMRMMCAGVFDRFPNLKIILGHLGEALPYWQWRIDNFWVKNAYYKKLKKRPSEYLRDNFYISTSGMFSQTALIHALMSIGADNILFAIDYPFEIAINGTKFIDSAPISTGDREKICFLTAERLFRLEMTAES